MTEDQFKPHVRDWFASNGFAVVGIPREDGSSMVMSSGRTKLRFSRSYELSMALSIFKPSAWVQIPLLCPSNLQMNYIRIHWYDHMVRMVSFCAKAGRLAFREEKQAARLLELLESLDLEILSASGATNQLCVRPRIRALPTDGREHRNV